MDLLTLGVVLVLAALLTLGGFWVCDRAGFPPPVRWLFGAVVLVVVIYALLHVAGLAPPINLHKQVLP